MLSRAERKRLSALRRRKDRAETGLFVAEGVRLVEDALASGIVLDVALVAPSLEDTPRGAALARALRERVRTQDVTDAELGDIVATETPQGVAVVAQMPRYALHDVTLPARALILALDAVQDPGNFGTVVRSAEAFGATCVLTLPGTVDPWNAKAVRAAMGSSLRLPIIDATLPAAIEWLRLHECRILGADSSGVNIETMHVTQRVALVLGNEGAGLSDAVRAALDDTVAVPIRARTESLNVGVAAGILLYLLSRDL
jgi:RNA methyltransferase, TrmH family